MRQLKTIGAVALTVSICMAVSEPATAQRSRLGPRGRAIVRDIHRTTGYLLKDAGPRSNTVDRRGWTTREVRRMRKVLNALPSQLKFLTRGDANIPGHLITRDAMNQSDRQTLHSARSRLTEALGRGGTSKQRLKVRGHLALVKVMSALKVGSTFGHAYRDRPEIRLYNELFLGSRLPGLRKMLAFTTVHEIGHRQLFEDRDLQRAWREHYFQRGGQKEYVGWCSYAAGSYDEGYGVGIGTFAVAPQLLRKKAPRTYAFFVERFGADAFRSLRGGPIARLAIQLTYGMDDVLAGQR